MPEVPEKIAGFLDLLSTTQDRAERIQLLIDVASRFRKVPETIATPPYPKEHRTPACESDAYVWAEEQPDGTLRYHFAVENPQGISAMAMAVILDDGLAGASPEEALAVPRDIVYRIFGEELSMGKSMGLMGMVGMVHRFARQILERRATKSSPPRGP